MRIRPLLWMGVAALAGCNQLYGESRRIVLEGAALQKSDESIVLARLREHNTSTLSPTFAVKQVDGRMVIDVKGAPAEADVRYLLTHRGGLKVASEGGLPWFSQKDIVETNVGFDDQQRVALHMRLSEAAAARVARLSSDGMGATIIVTLDGQKLSSPRVGGPITGGRLQVTLPDKNTQEAMLISTILNSGVLSAVPKTVQVQPMQ